MKNKSVGYTRKKKTLKPEE